MSGNLSPTIATMSSSVPEKGSLKPASFLAWPPQVLAIMLACFQCLFVSNSFSEEKIDILTGEWAPYTSAVADGISAGGGGGYGLAIEIVSAVLQEMDQKPNFIFDKWDNVLPRLAKGPISYAFPYVKSAEREKAYVFSDALFNIRSTIFYNIENISQQSGQRGVEKNTDFASYSVGLVGDGYSYETTLLDKFRDKHYFPTEFLAFEAMVLGKVDMVLTEFVVGDTFIRNYFVDRQHEVARLRNFEIYQPVFLIARKEQPSTKQFFTAFNRSLTTIKNRGLLRKISNQYAMIQNNAASVRLIGSGNFPLAFGSIDKDSELGFLIPRNSRAAVVEWNVLFENETGFDIHKAIYEKTRVKILEGPLENQLLWVPNMFLSYE